MIECRDSRTGRGHDHGEGCVLVVEDDPMLRRVVVKTLQTWGYLILEAPDGQDAVEKALSSSTELSVILLDIMLPLINGLEVARRVRAERPEIPIVACSAALTEEIINEMNTLGVRVFLPKPYSAETLRATLTLAARRRDRDPGLVDTSPEGSSSA